MTDQDIIHIQAKTEFIIQHTIKQTCTDTVIRLYQINPTILTRSEPTGKRSNECLLRIEEERIAQTGIIGPSFLFGRCGSGAGSRTAIVYPMLYISLHPSCTECIWIIQSKRVRFHKVIPQERADICFRIQTYHLEEYIVRIRIESGKIKIVLKCISQFGIIRITRFQIFLSTSISVLILIERERIHHILRGTWNTVG